jgi:hypothetical protein
LYQNTFMTIDFDDDYEDFDDHEMEDLDDGEHHDEVEDLDDGEYHDDVENLDNDEHHDEVGDLDEGEYVPPAPRRAINPRSLSPVLSTKPRSGGLFPCQACKCERYLGIQNWGYTCERPTCKHLYDEH